MQHPGRKCGTSLVLGGLMGVGKTIIGKTMGALLGRHYFANRDRYITGQFNSHLASCLLLHADEAFWAGDKSAEGVLKDLVTGHQHLIEFKQFEPIAVRNYVRLLVTSNNDWVVPAGMEERRFAILKVGDARMQDRPYFAAIEAQLEAGGYAALLHHLLEFDLTTVDVAVIPKTRELLTQKIESMTALQKWWLTTLSNGTIPPGGVPDRVSCPVKALHDSYLDHAKKMQDRKPMLTDTQFGIAMLTLMPVGKAGKPERIRWQRYYQHDGGGVATNERGYFYELPSLAECRARFEELIGQSFDWGDDLKPGDGPAQGELEPADWVVELKPPL